jgi:hypothetical protein
MNTAKEAYTGLPAMPTDEHPLSMMNFLTAHSRTNATNLSPSAEPVTTSSRSTRGVLFLLLLWMLAGCASTPSSSQARVQVFRDGQLPTQTYTEVQLLTDSGALREQGEIEAKMVKKAAKLGADALIFDTPVKEGGELQGFSWVQTYLYRARAVALKP